MMIKINKIFVYIFILSIILFTGFNLVSTQEYPLGLDPWYHIAVIKDINEFETVRLEHPFDRTYPNTYSYNYHILSALLTKFSGINTERIINLESILFWLLISLMFYLIVKKIFNNERAAVIALLVSSAITTNYFFGGPLLPRPQVMTDFLFLLGIYIFLMIFHTKEKDIKLKILGLIILVAIVNTHIFLSIVFFLILILIFITSYKRDIKFLSLLFIFFLLSLSIIVLPIIVEWGLPIKDSAENIVSISIRKVFLGFEDLSTYLGSFIPIWFWLSPIIIFFSLWKCKYDQKKSQIFILLWFASFLLLSQSWRFGLTLTPHRFLYLTIFPLIIIISLSIEKILKLISKRFIFFLIFFLVLLLFLQISNLNIWLTHPERDVTEKETYLALLWLGRNSNEQDKILTDQWSDYHIAAIARRGVFYKTGLYINQEIKTQEVIDIFLNYNLDNLRKYNIKFIYIYKPYTTTWLSYRSKISLEEIDNRLDNLNKEERLLKVFENNKTIIYKVK